MARKQVKKAEAETKTPPNLAFWYESIDQIHPYDKNPRFNEDAIQAVANSIEEFGFNVPIMIDEQGVIIAGHTRYAAAQVLGLQDVPVVLNSNLDDDQIRAFRLVDNKVAELATWNNDFLSEEMQALGHAGIDFSVFGWTQEALDCLTEVVADDCLSVGVAATLEQEDNSRNAPRGPATTRMVIGEFVLRVPQGAYRSWSNEIRTEGDYDDAEIQNILLERLGVNNYME